MRSKLHWTRLRAANEMWEKKDDSFDSMQIGNFTSENFENVERSWINSAAMQHMFHTRCFLIAIVWFNAKASVGASEATNNNRKKNSIIKCEHKSNKMKLWNPFGPSLEYKKSRKIHFRWNNWAVYRGLSRGMRPLWCCVWPISRTHQHYGALKFDMATVSTRRPQNHCIAYAFHSPFLHF